MPFTILVIWIRLCQRVINLLEEANAILAHGGEFGQPLLGFQRVSDGGESATCAHPPK